MGAITPKEDYTNIPHETFDAVIVGGGGSGMRAFAVFFLVTLVLLLFVAVFTIASSA
jgi:succinate dehydrogenase / fumarate reductase flavoprotein subunit